MSDKYDIELSPEQRQLFVEWNKKFPPGVWEKHWAKEVEKMEGYKNYYITGNSTS